MADLASMMAKRQREWEEQAEEEGEEEDADYDPHLDENATANSAPGRSAPKPKKKRRKKKRRVKKVQLADFDVLSLPKAMPRLDPELNLQLSALKGAVYDELQVSELGKKRLPKHWPASDYRALIVAGSADGGPADDDPKIVQYRKIYDYQLPGVGFFDDAYHVLLSEDKAGTVVCGGATFRMLLLTTSTQVLLVIDVLAVCTDPERAGVHHAGRLPNQSPRPVLARAHASVRTRPLQCRRAGNWIDGPRLDQEPRAQRGGHLGRRASTIAHAGRQRMPHILGAQGRVQACAGRKRARAKPASCGRLHNLRWSTAHGQLPLARVRGEVSMCRIL
jgi:hypothetical protein